MQPSVEVVREEGSEASSWGGDELLPHGSEAGEDAGEAVFHGGLREKGGAGGEGGIVDFGEEGEGGGREGVEDVDAATWKGEGGGRGGEGSDFDATNTRALLPA